MKVLIKLEELGMLLLCITILFVWDAPWWCYLIMAVGPDISMLGYLGGDKAGAFCYNLFHHKGLAVILIVIGMANDSNIVFLSGIILFGHSSMDRFFGYGLKYENGFKFTHLGVIGKNKSINGEE